MTTTYHTAIAAGAAANAATINTPLSGLDTALGTVATEVATARGGYTALDDRLDALVLAGSNVATLTNGAASAGQKVVTVDSTTGFLAGAPVAYTLVGGVIESNTVGTVDSPTQLTLGTNIGTGGIANDTYLAVITLGSLMATGAVIGATGSAQAFTTGVRVGAGWGSDDTAINAKRTLTGVVNSHAYRDESALTPATDSVGYASYDSQYTLAGSVSYDHFAGFQNRPVFSGSGTITKHVGYWSLPVHNGAGTITNVWHHYVADVTGGGPITNQVGLYIAELTAGTTENWGVVVAGATKSYFGGEVQLAAGLRVAGNAAFGGVDVSTLYQVYVSATLDATKVVGLEVNATAPVNVSSASTYGAYINNRSVDNTLASIGTNDLYGIYSRSGLAATTANSAARGTYAASFQNNYTAASGKTSQATTATAVLVDAISATGDGTITIGTSIGINIKQQGTAKATAAYGLLIDAQSGAATNYAIYTGTGDVRLMGSATDKLGFHGATPVAQQTLATGAGATVDNVITALQNLGLVKQA